MMEIGRAFPHVFRACFRGQPMQATLGALKLAALARERRLTEASAPCSPRGGERQAESAGIRTDFGCADEPLR